MTKHFEAASLSSLNIQRDTGEDAGRPLLEVSDLRTAFRTGRGVVRAVDGVSFSVQRGVSLGIVGESGSGKTVLSRSIMGLLPRRGTLRSGSVRYAGVEVGDCTPAEMRHLWGTEMAMVFQDPMTALNPVMRIGRQITESLEEHLDRTRGQANETAEKLLATDGVLPVKLDPRLVEVLASAERRLFIVSPGEQLTTAHVAVIIAAWELSECRVNQYRL